MTLQDDMIRDMHLSLCKLSESVGRLTDHMETVQRALTHLVEYEDIQQAHAQRIMMIETYVKEDKEQATGKINRVHTILTAVIGTVIGGAVGAVVTHLLK